MSKYEESCYKEKGWITGEVQDTIIDKDGNRTELPKEYNVVVSNCSAVIAALLKSIWSNDPDNKNNRSGIRYWAIGDCIKNGVVDSSNPSESDTSLRNEVYRQEILPAEISFVNEGGASVSEPTNRLQIKIIIEYDKGNMTDSGSISEWREFGIFVGPNATLEEGSGIMINHKVHGAIAKTNNIKVERTLIFTF